MPADPGAGPATAVRGRAPATQPQMLEPERPQPGEVRAMFDRIAGVYDVMNSAMTAGLHHRWRARAAQLASLRPGARALDVATGTGDMAIELARRVGAHGEVVGSDFSQAMLARARAKAGGGAQGALRFELGDALALPYGDGCFDAATVAFGLRNFSDRERGLRELARVVAPGGRVVVLEITTPTRAPLKHFYAIWFDRLVPLAGRAAAALERRVRRGEGERPPGAIAAAYRYLPSSVRRFPSPPALAAEMRDAGLIDVRWLLLAGSIIAIHVGTVPGPGAPDGLAPQPAAAA